MTAAPITTSAPTLVDPGIRARKAGFGRDVASVGGRALRRARREPEAIVPALIIPVFFYVVNIGQLQEVSRQIAGLDAKAFQLPVAVIFAVTGISQATALVTDIQTGYFDRLLMTPVKRLALLLGLMVADFALVIFLTVPVVILGFITGVRFETGPLGVLAFILISALWGLGFTGFPYAIALKTGNPGAVAASFILFFPFAFLTTTFLPENYLTGWLATVADYNPVTYLLDALRAIISDGWVAADILPGLVAIAGVAMVSISLALITLRGRLKRGG